jgi:hypothetical protein
LGLGQSKYQKNMSKKSYFYYSEENDPNIFEYKITQYMRLDYLFELLETNKYHVTKRGEFEDAFEIAPVNTFLLSLEPAEDYFKKDKDRTKVSKKIEQIEKDCKDLAKFPISCWCKKENESSMMWKLYAHKIGACIKTTISKFIDSIDLDLSAENVDKIVCGSINYRKMPCYPDEKGMFFTKDIGYSEEEEFRFYFDFNKFVDNDKKFAKIPIRTKEMIDEIILSPFISKKSADIFSEILKERYNIKNVKHSNMRIK